MNRTDYVYVAARIDASDPQNLGDYSIGRRGNYDVSSLDYRPFQCYHYDSTTRRLTNRTALRHISKGSRIYAECLKAIGRLQAEERTGDCRE